MSAERAKLEQAITTLESQRTNLGDVVVEASIAALKKQLAELKPTLPNEQQRKQVTVLFADVSGFTAMSETMDAEDVNEVMNALWQRLDKIIIKHSGFIDKHIGDAVMALWGVKSTRESDPEQAIRAALHMQTGLTAFREERDVTLAMRIGLSTGPVLLGKVATTAEYTAIGDTVNTANRLEQYAPIGEILISHDTYRHVRGVFDVTPQADLHVRGKAEPIQTYIIHKARPRAFRVSTRGVEGVETRMIGRQGELVRLQKAMYEVIEEYQRQAFTIVGEAGIGKSRLLYEFNNWIDLLPETVRYFKGRARLETQNVPYALLRDLFAFRFEIQESDPSKVVQNKVERGIAEVFDKDTDAEMCSHFLGHLLGFGFKDSLYLKEFVEDAPQLHARSLAFLVDYFEALDSIRPIVIFLEDLHWADDSSLEALDYLMLRTSSLRMLLVGTARPILYERRPDWGENQNFHAHVNLQVLSKRESHHLIMEILQKVDRLPRLLSNLVAKKAEGNPYYIEELIKMLIEEGVVIKDEDVWHVEPERLVEIHIPSTLTGVLQARLDTLPISEREVLQCASVVGRIFWDDLIRLLNKDNNPGNNYDVEEALANLCTKEMIFVRETSIFNDTREYFFKHAILRDVTYEGVLKRKRQIYHNYIAHWLIEQSGERIGEYTGLIADHLELGGQTNDAIVYLYQAGNRAILQYSYVEAQLYFDRALALAIKTGLDTIQRRMLLKDRALLLNMLGKQAAALSDLKEYYQEAVNDEDKIEALYLLGRQYTAIGQHIDALEAHHQALAMAEAINNIAGQAGAYTGIGSALRSMGKIEKSVPNLERALTLFQQVGDKGEQAWVGNQVGISYARLGQLDKAIIAFQKALKLARNLGVRETAVILSNLGEVYQILFDMEQALTYHQEAVILYDSLNLPGGESDLYRNLGVDLYYLGHVEEGMKYLVKALQIAEQEGRPNLHMQALYSIALAELEYGLMKQAHEHTQKLIILAQAGSANSYLAKALHLEAMYHHFLEKKIEEARQLYKKASVLARETGQQMLLWQIYAALSDIGPTSDLIIQYRNKAIEVIQEIVKPIEDKALREEFLNATYIRAGVHW